MQRLLTKRLGLTLTTKFHQAYILKNGTVVNADLSEINDVIIEDNIITAVGKNFSAKNAKVIDCTGKMIIPGGIDTHTHMQLPFMGSYAIDDFDWGTKACLAGGTTSHIDFAIPSQTETLTQAYQTWRGWADPKVNCDYALHSAITSWNQDTKDQMRRMVDNGIQSFKFFMAYNNVLRIDDVSMFRAFEYARQLGAICIVHAQNGDIISMNTERLLKLGITGPEGHYLSRPPSVEAQATHRVITIAEHANCPVYIVHLMSRQSSEQVMRAKNRGQIVFGQTLAATLGTDGTKLWDKDWDVASRYVMSPCLNPDPTVKTQIMKYLNSGVIDVVGTDNCTFCTDQKQLGRDSFAKIPNGVNGLQDRMAVVWTKGVRAGLLSENQFVEVTSTKAARIFNMYPNKGLIRPGADADVVVWDPNHKKVICAKHHHQKVDYNIFEGMEVYGKACYTFSRGNLVWDGQSFHNQHKGKYVSRKPFGYSFARHKMLTEANDPLKWKVDRSNKTAESQQSQIQKLQKELKKTREQRDKLLKEIKNKK